MNNTMLLQLSTFPACSLGTVGELTMFRKEVIKVGHYKHPDTGQEFDVTPEILNHWVVTFNRYVENGNKVPIPLGHAREGLPEANAGWVSKMAVEDNSLYCIMELSEPDLALTTDVSICIENKVIDGKENVYENVITHVALCTNPVITGLDKFTKLSLSVGETNMEFLNKIAEKLGLSKDKVTEDDVLSALDKPEDKPEAKLSAEPVPQVVKLVASYRGIKLSGLVTAGLITPAVKDLIEAKYVKDEAVKLELSKGADNGFDFIYQILSQNSPVELKEVTNAQSLELSRKTATESPLKADVNRRRKEAGLDK